ncbi:VanZ family protein [Neobacillus niacini]
MVSSYAITDEWHEFTIPERLAAYWDVLFDSFGGVSSFINQLFNNEM